MRGPPLQAANMANLTNLANVVNSPNSSTNNKAMQMRRQHDEIVKLLTSAAHLQPVNVMVGLSKVMEVQGPQENKTKLAKCLQMR